MEIDYTQLEHKLANKSHLLDRLTSTLRDVLSTSSISSGTSIVVNSINEVPTVTPVGCCSYLSKKSEYTVGIVHGHPSFYNNPELSEEWIREMGKMFDFSVERIPEEVSSKYSMQHTKYDTLISQDSDKAIYLATVVLEELVTILNKYVATVVKEYIRELVQDKGYGLIEVRPIKNSILYRMKDEDIEKFINAIEFSKSNIQSYPLALLGALSRHLFPYLKTKGKMPIRKVRSSLVGLYSSRRYLDIRSILLPIDHSKLENASFATNHIFVESIKDSVKSEIVSNIYHNTLTYIIDVKELPIDKKGLEKDIDNLMKFFKIELNKLDRREIKPSKVFYKIKPSYGNSLVSHTIIRCLWEPYKAGDQLVFSPELYFQARELYPNIDPYFILGMVLAGKNSSYGSPWGGDRVYIKRPNPDGESDLEYYLRKCPIMGSFSGIINTITKTAAYEAESLIYTPFYPISDLKTLRNRIDEKLKKFLTP